MRGIGREGGLRRRRRMAGRRPLSLGGREGAIEGKIGNDGDRRKLSARFLIKMQIRGRATSLRSSSARLGFLPVIPPSVSALPLLASIDLSFLAALA